MTKSIDTAELKARMAAGGVTIFDVRKRPAYEDDDAVITGATWRDPFAVADWGPALAGAGAIVCYCVHGHEVSQGVAAALGDLGIEAAYLEGGIAGWRDAGGALAPKP